MAVAAEAVPVAVAADAVSADSEHQRLCKLYCEQQTKFIHSRDIISDATDWMMVASARTNRMLVMGDNPDADVALKPIFITDIAFFDSATPSDLEIIGSGEMIRAYADALQITRTVLLSRGKTEAAALILEPAK